MINSINDNRIAFVDTYKAHFGYAPFKEDGVANYWWEVIDLIPPGRAKELVKRVSQGWGERGGKPRIPVFEAAIWRMRREERGDIELIPACNWCNYTGWIIFWMMCPDYPATRKSVLVGLGTWQGDYRDCNVYSFATPCNCKRGMQAYYACRDNIDDETRDMILAKGFETFGTQIEGDMPWTEATKNDVQNVIQ